MPHHLIRTVNTWLTITTAIKAAVRSDVSGVPDWLVFLPDWLVFLPFKKYFSYYYSYLCACVCPRLLVSSRAEGNFLPFHLYVGSRD